MEGRKPSCASSGEDCDPDGGEGLPHWKQSEMQAQCELLQRKLRAQPGHWSEAADWHWPAAESSRRSVVGWCCLELRTA